MRNNMLKIFLILTTIFFSFTCVGCEQTIPFIDDGSVDDGSNLDFRITGPIVNYQVPFDSNDKFQAFIEKFNTQDKTFVSFDFKEDYTVVSAKYNFETIISTTLMDKDGQIYDNDISSYVITYNFESLNHPVGSGIENDKFIIECRNVKGMENVDKESINFEKKTVEENTYKNIYKYIMYADDQLIMEIDITVGFDSSEDLVFNLIKMLQESMVLIK